MVMATTMVMRATPDATRGMGCCCLDDYCCCAVRCGRVCDKTKCWLCGSGSGLLLTSDRVRLQSDDLINSLSLSLLPLLPLI